MLCQLNHTYNGQLYAFFLASSGWFTFHNVTPFCKVVLPPPMLNKRYYNIVLVLTHFYLTRDR